MAIVAFFTILSWLAVTFLTKPESPEILQAFYRKIRPGGPGWKPIASEIQDDVPDQTLGLQITGALVATAMIYTILPGIGYLIFHHWFYASGCLIGSLILGVILAKIIQRLFSKPTPALKNVNQSDNAR